MKIRTLDICLCAAFAALVAIGAFIRIPLPPCPFTLQVTFTTLAGLLLGRKRGALSVAIYVLIGLIGVPVFTQGGGPAYVMQPTFGYLAGFILSTYITGAIAEKYEKPSVPQIIFASLAGMAVVYIIGMVYLYLICNYLIGNAMTIKATIYSCFILVFPGNLAMCIISAFLAKRLIPIFRKMLNTEEN